MPICPQCESENPKINKFCQSCGASLADKLYHPNSKDMPLAINNDESSAPTNPIVLWAIIEPPKQTEGLVPTEGKLSDNIHKFRDSNVSKPLSQASSEETYQIPDRDWAIKNTQERFPVPQTSQSDQPEINLADFFNRPQNDTTNLKRYVFASYQEVLAEITANNSEAVYVRGKVIDRYPRQPSHLATVRKQQKQIFEELKCNLNNSYLTDAETWHSLGIPIHTLPYLILERYTPAVPKIYDAWQQADGGATLLEDRSDWQLLTELWSREELPPAQVLWFLDEMAKLWVPLSKIGCSRSLLLETNIRVDEDRAFCLQQLFLDEPENIPSLKNLAWVWQTWSNKLPGKYRQELDRIFNRVISEEIQNIEQLHFQLQELDSELYEQHFFDFGEISDSDFQNQVTVNYSMQLASVVDAGCTNVGTQRNRNEDFFAIETSIIKQENNTNKNLSVRGLYIVCDGMGGHAAGDVASEMAVETLVSYFQTHWLDDLPDRATIEAGILLANDTIYQTNLDNSSSGSGRMGTTLAIALLHDRQLAIAHVGDSRIYYVSRQQGLERLTLDHEVGQREIGRGVEPDIAYGRPDAYQLTQALGPRSSKYIKPEIQFVEITEDCLILLCSDGLCDRDLIENHWQEYLEPLISSNSNLEEGLFKLVDFADRHNGHDNITGISIRIKLKPEF